MLHKNLISVIIPIYNVKEYLNECIDSILNQTYKNLEIILVNDGSTDGSVDICHKYTELDSRITLISQTNQGVVKARNSGISIAHGEYISFLDADDWIDPTMYEELLSDIGSCDLIVSDYVQNYPNIEAPVLHSNPIPEGTYDTPEKFDYILKNTIYYKDTDQKGINYGLCNKLFRTEIIKSYYLDINPTITIGEDFVFFSNYLLRSSSIVVKHKAYYHYRVRLGSATQSINKMFLHNMNDLYLSLESLFLTHPLSEHLLKQLQKRVTSSVMFGLNYRMGFYSDSKPCYRLQDYSHLINKTIILYGAGHVGKDFEKQLTSKINCNLILWVDNNFEVYQNKNMPVQNPNEIFSVKYDYIILGVKSEQLAREIRNYLILNDVDPNKILWENPQIV